MRSIAAFTVLVKDHGYEGVTQINEELDRRKVDAGRVISVSRILVRSGLAMNTVYYLQEE